MWEIKIGSNFSITYDKKMVRSVVSPLQITTYRLPIKSSNMYLD